jgi:hypothetical protein
MILLGHLIAYLDSYNFKKKELKKEEITGATLNFIEHPVIL